MNRLVTLGVVSALVVSGLAVAAPAKNEAEAKAAIDARVAHFKEMGKAMEPIGNMLRRKQPYDAAVVEKQSLEIAELSKKIPALYEVDTRQFKDIKTEALDGIWGSLQDFNAKANGLTTAANALAAASKNGGNQASFTKDASAVGKACSACHDAYRIKKS